MPVSFEGLAYERILFKPVDNCEDGGLHADVYLPTEKKNGYTSWPVAMAIHGGGFCLGDTKHIFVGHFEYLLEQGFCVVVVEYRLAPHAHQKEQREDWVDAYKWITSPKGLNAALGSKGQVDRERVFVCGASAGGVACWFLTIDLLAAKLPLPKALYVIYPVTDLNLQLPNPPVTPQPFSKFPELVKQLSEKEQQQIKELFEGPIGTGFSLRGEFDRPVHPRRVWFDFAASNGMLVPQWVDEFPPPYSPEKNMITQFSSDFPPTVLIKAMADKLVPTEHTQSAYDKLTELGVETKLFEARGMEHGDVEETTRILQRWGRELAHVWWEEAYKPATDFCIAKCRA
ncbi:hypothetical protein M231_02257 [Tremella mesenterica]|uniref:Alpha/beta hydrolase fold-3 domain-containing protein n=1 Tax=Tremella mesenterica TaxID=5217 RepID=A0A4Q1BR53_TREME|nr:uncharacterized protein TREMEDRAFT_74739 [Tremella mesenterica DSM 1558]EIW66558.1 hypothetical protein TREMEDRAFT_74739 [Tremella mesenterica DSM 1558]RXK40424.1 hypothetical protein M231_02257 [Tremella mesenterica]